LLQAVDLKELICASPDDYVTRAIAYGRDPASVKALHARLTAGRDTYLLFDTPKLVHSLEQLYQGMWDDFERGMIPAPDLKNLDVYHEVALELDHEQIELLDDEQYRRSYLEKLEHRHATYPIEPDRRFWSGPKD
jgi:hypothetical protein